MFGRFITNKYYIQQANIFDMVIIVIQEIERTVYKLHSSIQHNTQHMQQTNIEL